MNLLIFFVGFVISISLALEDDAPTISCINANATKQHLDAKMKFPTTYKVSAIFTDLMSSRIERITEVRKDDTIAILRQNRDGVNDVLISNNGKASLQFNRTSWTCVSSDTTSSPFPFFPKEVLSALGSNGLSLASIVDGIVNQAEAYPIGEGMQAGVLAVKYMTCANNSLPANTTVQIEVYVTGEKSIAPPSPAFNNPLLVWAHFTYYNFTASSSVSPLLSNTTIEFAFYDSLTAEDEQLLEIPDGIVCDKWKYDPLPLTFSDPFNANILYSDEKGTQNYVQVLYNAADKLVAVSGSTSTGILPFFNQKGTPTNAQTVVHDFLYGYEYSMSNDRCLRLIPLSNDTSDVLVDNGLFTLRKLSDIFIPSDLLFIKTGITKTPIGTLDVYRADDKKNNQVVQVELQANQLRSSTRYSNKKIASKIEIFPSTTTFRRSDAKNCLFNSATGSSNSSYILQIQTKNLNDVYTIGVENLRSAISSALSNIAPINTLRVDTHFTMLNDKLGVLLYISEKNAASPSNVGYNYSAEVSTSQLISKLNDTVVKGDWKFNVNNFENKTEEWSVAASSLSRFPLPPPPPPPTPYVGYSGGSMFVLGLFALLFGTAIGAGGLFFITKRQQINTMAYQVFE